MTDELSILGIECFAHHGVFDHERRDGQVFRIDLTLAVDTAPAAASDDLRDTVDYGSLVDQVVAAVTRDPVALIETLAQRIKHGPIPVVRASYANFIWGTAREKDAAWPSLGLSTRAAEDGRRTVIDVEKDSPASKAGIAVGDLIIAIDKTPIDNRETLNRVMAGYQWGDVPQVTVRRGDAEQTFGVALRRQP